MLPVPFHTRVSQDYITCVPYGYRIVQNFDSVKSDKFDKWRAICQSFPSNLFPVNTFPMKATINL